MAFAGKWIDLEIIMLHEICQTKMDTACFLLCGIWDQEDGHELKSDPLRNGKGIELG